MAGLGINKMKRPGQKVSGPAAPYTGGDARPRPPGFGGGPPAPGAPMTAPGTLAVSNVNKGPGRPGGRGPVALPPPAIPRSLPPDSNWSGGVGGAPVNTGNQPSIDMRGMESWQDFGQSARESIGQGDQGYSSGGGVGGAPNAPGGGAPGGGTAGDPDPRRAVGKTPMGLGVRAPMSARSDSGFTTGGSFGTGSTPDSFVENGPAPPGGARGDLPMATPGPYDEYSKDQSRAPGYGGATTTTTASGVGSFNGNIPAGTVRPGAPNVAGPPVPNRIQNAVDQFGRPISIPGFPPTGPVAQVPPPNYPVPTPKPQPGPPAPRPAGGGQTARPGGRPDRQDLGRPAGGVVDFTNVIPGSPMGQNGQYAGEGRDPANLGSDPYGFGGMANNGFGSPGYGVNPGMSAGVDAWGNEIQPGSPQDVATGNDSGGNNSGGGGAAGGGGGGAPGGGTAGDPEARSKVAGKTPRGLGARPPADPATTRAAPNKKLPAKGATPDPATAAPAEQALATPPPAGTPDPSATATPPGAITAQGAPAPTGLNVGTEEAAAAAAKANGNKPPPRVPPSGSITNGNRNVQLENVPDSTTVQDQLAGILDQDSVLMQQAAARGLQQANRRGLLNSSIAVGSSQAALYDAAVPIASQQAQLSQAEREAVLNRNQSTTFKDWELRSADRNAAATFLSNMEQIYGNMYASIMGNEKMGKGARRRAIKDLQREQDARQRAVEDMYDFNITF